MASREAPIISTLYFLHAMTRQIERAVQRRLSTHGRQYRIRPLFGNDVFQYLPGNRLDISDIGHIRVGHDGRWIGIDQNDLETFFAQRFTRLSTGIVELTSLTDDDRTGTNDKNAMDVCTLRHFFAPSA
jgi:hypothetical protein